MEIPMEARIARIEADVAHLRSDVADIKVDMRARFDRMDARMDRLESKIDSRTDELRKSVDGVKDRLASAQVWALVLYFALAGSMLGVMARGFGWISPSVPGEAAAQRARLSAARPPDSRIDSARAGSCRRDPRR